MTSAAQVTESAVVHRAVRALVREQVPVQVKRHARRGVTEHLLNHLYIGTGRDCKRSCRMP